MAKYYIIFILFCLCRSAHAQYQFTYLADFKGTAFYGFADSAGNTLTAGYYNLISQPKDGLCRVTAGRKAENDYDNARYGFCRPDGVLVVAPKYVNAKDFSEGMAAVAVANFPASRWGFINQQGEEIIYPQFVQVQSFSEGLAPVATADKQWKYIDKTGSVKIAGPFRSAAAFSEGLAAVTEEYDAGAGVKHFRVGYIDKTGAWVVKPQNKWIVGRPFKNGTAVITVSSEKAYALLIDKTGKVLTTKPYQRINDPLDDDMRPVQLSGASSQAEPTVWSVIDKNGNEVQGLLLDRIAYYREGLIAFSENKKYGYKDRAGKVVIPARYASAGFFSEGLAPVSMEEKGLLGFINKKGEMVIKPAYLHVTDFNSGLAAVAKGEGLYSKKTTSGVIDKTGKVVIPFDSCSIGAFEDGRAVATKKYVSYYLNKDGSNTLAADIETIVETRYAILTLARNDVQGAYDILLKLKPKNYPLADYYLGYILLYGKPPLQNIAEGRRLIMAAANNNQPMAMYMAGLIHGTGVGGAVDYAKAMEWYNKADKSNVPASAKDLGVMYEAGLGVTADPAKAAVYYKRAALQGDASAMYNLGLLYASGKGVSKNTVQTHTWMTRAAEFGSPQATAYLQNQNIKK
jgi:TPR repeat protein